MSDMVIKSNNRHDLSIDILKFLAALIITWSHFEAPLGRYSVLATGGTFGDVLFFFCSGYTLFLGKEAGFLNWYKRRINRIYPTVFAWALLSSVMLNVSRNMFETITSGGGWFVSCIMIYYVILWFIRKYALDRLTAVIAVVSILTVVWYFTIETCSSNYSMYGETYFKWFHYFIFMLYGAICGLRYKQQGSRQYSIYSSLAIVVVSVVLFYVLFSFYKKDGILNAVQLLSLMPLAGVCLGFYRMCNSNFADKLYYNKIAGTVIKLVGGLCLEIYIVQWPFLTDSLNGIFPLNLVFILAAIIVAAYILRCIARVWAQTFKDGDYNLKEIVKPY